MASNSSDQHAQDHRPTPRSRDFQSRLSGAFGDRPKGTLVTRVEANLTVPDAPFPMPPFGECYTYLLNRILGGDPVYP